jgi:hypothetical protein
MGLQMIRPGVTGRDETVFKSNVVPFGVGHVPTSQRIVEEISFERFCIADELGEWETRHQLPNGIIILQYPRATIICCPNNCCTVIRQTGTDIEAYFEEAIEHLDKVA